MESNPVPPVDGVRRRMPQVHVSQSLSNAFSVFMDGESKVKPPSLSWMCTTCCGHRRVTLRALLKAIVASSVALLVVVTLLGILSHRFRSSVQLVTRRIFVRDSSESDVRPNVHPLRVEQYPSIFVADSQGFGQDNREISANMRNEGAVGAAAQPGSAASGRPGGDSLGMAEVAVTDMTAVASAHLTRSLENSVTEVVVPPGVDAGVQPVQRLIVLTMDRPDSLKRLLKSLALADYGGDRVDLDIWIDCLQDRSRAREVMDSVAHVARDQEWAYGVRSVHMRKKNAGLYDQWIYTWNITASTTESVVILEDDLEVSSAYYAWLKAARALYRDDSSIAAYTLQRAELRPRQRPGIASGKLKVDSEHGVFKYKLLGTWGFAPQKHAWMKFRVWYEEMRSLGSKPYVEHLMTTDWYKQQEKKAGLDYAPTMWSQWFIKFSDLQNYYTLYANLANGTTLASNWREGGMHYSDKPRSADFPVFTGNASNFKFSAMPINLEWDGRPKQA